jgi:hypothetical protein
MKRVFLSLFAAVLILCTPQFSKGGTQAVSPDESDRLFKEILSKGLDMYHKYKGIEYLRTEVTSEYEPKTNKLLKVSEITVIRTDYFYEKPVAEVKTYKKDGKEMKPSKFNYMLLMPIFPIFDEKGRDNYDLRITDRKIFNGRECYLVQVTPRKETSRHFKGVLYYTVKNLEFVYLEGTLAKLDFPLKDFKIEFNTTMFNGIPVFSNGRVYLKIKIPIVYPETQIVSNITVLETKLIPL